MAGENLCRATRPVLLSMASKILCYFALTCDFAMIQKEALRVQMVTMPPCCAFHNICCQRSSASLSVQHGGATAICCALSGP
eukprot:1137795-Pelagomonas_calceolata.AAC.7